MSNQSVTVLCPNARRVVVKTSPNTSLLQILEEACAKQNYNADLYTLRHLQRTLDISSMFRFAGLPNRCVLEMLELAAPRQQQQITVCLTDAGGGRHVTQHLPGASLWAVVEASGVASPEGVRDGVPSVLFGIQRVCGRKALEDTSLKSLGLSGGRASLRFLLQADEGDKEALAPAASVAASTQKPKDFPTNARSSEPAAIPVALPASIAAEVLPSAWSLSGPQAQLADVAEVKRGLDHAGVASFFATKHSPDVASGSAATNQESPDTASGPLANGMSPDVTSSLANCSSLGVASMSQSASQHPPDVASASHSANQPCPDVVSLSRAAPDVVNRNDHVTRPPDVLTTEPVVSKVAAFSGTGLPLRAPAVAVDHSHASPTAPSQMMEVDSTQDSAITTLTSRSGVVFDESCVGGATMTQSYAEDDDFFELTSEDVRKLHRDQLHQLQELSEAPLLTRGMREADEQARLLACLRNFPVTTLRIQFPEGVAVQARFRPTDTVQDVALFVEALLRDEALQFDLLNMFPREPLSRLQTLHAAGLVPRARVLFCPHGGHDASLPSLLKPSVLAQLTTGQHALQALTPTRNTSTASSSSSSSSAGSAARQPPRAAGSSTAAGGDVGANKKPKWFKLAK